MKSSSVPMPANGNVVPLKSKRSIRAETEFLPAALEIIEAPASPLGRATALSIAAFIVIAIAWASIGQVDIIATSQGRVVPTGRSKIIQPFETGVVRRIAVSDGAIVKTGDVLIELDPTSDDSDETKSAFSLLEDRLDLARLHALLTGTTDLIAPEGAEPRLAQMARSQMEAQASQQAAKLEGLDRQIAQKQAERKEITAAIAKLQADFPLLREQRDIRQSLLQNQYGSRLAYLQIQQQLVDSQHDLDAQTEKSVETEQALAALAQQKAEASADYRKGLLTDLAKAEVSASEHGEDLRKAKVKRDLRTLTAPVDGTVQQLAVHTLGGIVTPAQQLMVIVPKGTGIEIEATLQNKDVGFVHVGQPVQVKIEAFTFTRYGLLHGTVTTLSQDVLDSPEDREGKARPDDQRDDADEAKRQARQPTYLAHVSLDADTIITEQGRMKIEPGMEVTAEIKTGQRSVMSYLLSPLRQFQQEGLRER